MNLEEDILIEKFLKGILSENEKETFLKRMDTDQEFKKKVVFEKQLQETFNDKEWSFIKEQTTEVKTYKEIYKSREIKRLQKNIQNENKVYQQSKKTIRRKWVLYASAAVIALLISVFIFYPASSPQELYIAYLEDSDLPSFISREDSNETNLIKAQQYFEKKEFAKSLAIFKNELEVSSTPGAGLYLYIGVAQTQLDQFEAAEETFDKLMASDLIDASKGKWHKALLYLKMEDLERSKALLNEIVQDSSYNHKIAKKLLKQLPSK